MGIRVVMTAHIPKRGGAFEIRLAKSITEMGSQRGLCSSYHFLAHLGDPP